MISYSLSKEYVDDFHIAAKKILEEEKISPDKHAQYIQAYIKMLNQKITLIYNLPFETSFPQKFSAGCQPILEEFYRNAGFHDKNLENRLQQTVLLQDVNEFINDMHQNLLDLPQEDSSQSPRAFKR